jgi:hypothetical protein
LENLRFTQAMLRELRQLMNADGEPLLTYLLDMAYLEVSDRTRTCWMATQNQAELTPLPPRKASRIRH